MYILVQRNIYIVSCSRGFLWTGCCRWIIFMSSYCGRICPGLLININSVFSLGGDLAVGGAHESWQFCIVCAQRGVATMTARFGDRSFYGLRLSGSCFRYGQGSFVSDSSFHCAENYICFWKASLGFSSKLQQTALVPVYSEWHFRWTEVGRPVTTDTTAILKVWDPNAPCFWSFHKLGSRAFMNLGMHFRLVDLFDGLSAFGLFHDHPQYHQHQHQQPHHQHRQQWHQCNIVQHLHHLHRHSCFFWLERVGTVWIELHHPHCYVRLTGYHTESQNATHFAKEKTIWTGSNMYHNPRNKTIYTWKMLWQHCYMFAFSIFFRTTALCRFPMTSRRPAWPIILVFAPWNLWKDDWKKISFALFSTLLVEGRQDVCCFRCRVVEFFLASGPPFHWVLSVGVSGQTMLQPHDRPHFDLGMMIQFDYCNLSLCIYVYVWDQSV